MNRPCQAWMTILLSLCLILVLAAADRPPEPPTRQQADALFQDGNWQEAYDAYAALALDPQQNPQSVPHFLERGVQCLQQLGRISEFDAFVEKAVAAHPDNWHVMASAAGQYSAADRWYSYGYIIAGQFVRGPHRGGRGRVVNSLERDRVRALQLQMRAIELADEKADSATLWMTLASYLLSEGTGHWRGGWQLQYLTDLDTLPDYEEGYGWYAGRQDLRGAPVNPDGTPVFHYLPKSWEEAQSDGERWRWALAEAMRLNPGVASTVQLNYADFLRSQFGVQTMQYGGFWPRFGADGDEGRKDETGPYALHTLGEDETIARLASGIKRFKLPDEFNYIAIYKMLTEEMGNVRDQALYRLAEIFENRRQYEKAAEWWRRSIELRAEDWKRDRLNQIVGNWGEFEPIMTQPAGKGATVDFRFRNARRVQFTAHAIMIEHLLADVKAYLRSRPRTLEWQNMQVEDIGYRLVQQNQQEYIGEKVAEWGLDLEPRPGHFDKRITIVTPLQKPGAYLLSAKVEDGNESLVVLWLADTVIVQKNLDNGTWLFVADAVTGEPIRRANVEFFGYRQQRVENEATRTVEHIVHTTQFAEFTDADGQLTVEKQDVNYSWLITATTRDGRLAYTGFRGLWRGSYHDSEYNQRKAFVLTDRPVYRPEQTVKFKAWVNQAQYDREGRSPFAGQRMVVRIWNPRDEKVLEHTFTADQYGGFDGELRLEKAATLGVYRIEIVNIGGGTFRVEEYKKPEFEVKVEAPAEPVMLGETIAAKVTATYYFGAPVTEAKVNYKVLRSSHDARWYPWGRWDWLYGRGYWWFGYDYAWYPGWVKWGCRRPAPWWWDRPSAQPELVAEAEVAIGADGTVGIEIDTALAKAIQGDTDHRYEITAEVTDQSRRTIVGTGTVLVAREPFKVYAWVNRGYYRAGDVAHAQFTAQTLDNKPVQGVGELRLLRITYDEQMEPVETVVERWALNTDEQGRAEQQFRAARAGQYRLSYRVTDGKGRAIEGGHVFVVRGEQDFDGADFRFNEIELVPDKKEYSPGERVGLMVNTDRVGGWVVLFVRPANGVYLKPKVLHVAGKSLLEEIEVVKRDMPNFFIEAFTISDGRLYEEARQIVVPPEGRALNVEVVPSKIKYKPGEEASVQVKVSDPEGKPVVGSVVLTVYDKSVEYISGGANVPDIKEFFWKWRREHRPSTLHTLVRGSRRLAWPNTPQMQNLGVFGASVADELDGRRSQQGIRFDDRRYGATLAEPLGMVRNEKAGAPMLAMAAVDALEKRAAPGGELAAMVEPAVRREFADTAFWAAALTTDAEGTATVDFAMPENLTTWKARAWTMADGTRVGEATAEVITTKNLIIRLQAPRFFVEKDEVVLSAIVHNYLETKKTARVVLELEGDCLRPEPGDAFDGAETRVEIDPNGEKRVDWRVRVVQSGTAIVRMKALTDEESDAMEMRFPVLVHGMLKTESYSGAIRLPQGSAAFVIRVPAERKVEHSRLEIRYSPTLAGAMVDALPYLADYPYGCTEQTLNRFLPAVITQKVLREMGLDLKAIQEKRTNLNAQEIGDDVERAAGWKRFERNPVFDEELLADMVKAGVNRLTSMQNPDGGWGWFSGWNERSWPHTTAVIVHGLQAARDNDVALVPGVLERGIQWLQQYQAEQVQMLKNAEMDPKVNPWKGQADALDAFVYMILVNEKSDNLEMKDYLYRDRVHLPVYAKALFGLALHAAGDIEKRDMLLRNIDQFLVQDDENQTAYLRLPAEGWWYWYGSDTEANAWYLKLLAAVDPKSERASRLVKYLINNRKHATYWRSTRDTAYSVEALADYIRASGEAEPDMTVTVLIDGQPIQTVRIDKDNLFVFDNTVVLAGEQVSTGEHRIELRREGTGPLYFNAYLTNFTLEDPITRAGLEIKVERKYHKLVRVEATVKVEGARGQAANQRVEKFERVPLENLAMVKSGDLVEVELEIESKNDYEYLVFEDMKPAGFEPLEVRSGYTGNELGAYVEFRDERVVLFCRTLARGRHSVSYRMRSEIPGRFSALPTLASAMYAPELRANSDEIKLRVED